MASYKYVPPEVLHSPMHLGDMVNVTGLTQEQQADALAHRIVPGATPKVAAPPEQLMTEAMAEAIVAKGGTQCPICGGAFFAEEEEVAADPVEAVEAAEAEEEPEAVEV